MAGLLDLLNSDLGKQLISGASAQTGASESKTADVLSMAMPVLLGAMKKNASTQEGASGLMGALSEKHDGSILDNLGSILGGGSVDQDVMQDGAGILGHVLGGKQPVVENALSQKSGLDAGTVAQILKIAAPILLGVIGKQTKQNDVHDSDGLTGILGSMLGGQPQENQSLIEKLIDADGDGSVLDDVADMVLGSNKKKGGLGGMLGGLFGK
ncbi:MULTISPECIES: DUF937 domain-containing protein [unclassified Leeuwenhoekiella]|uniref:DUF937 domain-containing protein n=1 Tax=unclassified Leeuwenhoekiella TaxID=2615029 RepID=UPI000C5F4EF0|nr:MULTISPECIES: DUF937 domain-containing protein [unclassified Leeuwenhoekiella]MAW94949.1 hypothetical protein [Leeuwenhoekiella sp.]MBA79669.1 hypothetical protein [Leeuwenhoekiella sp.]|tara:strand:+ start:38234 stop:38869 length:636 start_codon:yes stop_codon:yes gene_type:complete